MSRQQRKPRPLPVDAYFRLHGIDRGGWQALADLGISSAPWSDETAALLIQLLLELGLDRQDISALYGRDAAAAIDDRDLPRLARVAFNLSVFVDATCASQALVKRDNEDTRSREARSDILFETFCMHWHEISGSPRDRARHIADVAGGKVETHLKRYQRHKADIEARVPK